MAVSLLHFASFFAEGLWVQTLGWDRVEEEDAGCLRLLLQEAREVHMDGSYLLNTPKRVVTSVSRICEPL